MMRTILKILAKGLLGIALFLCVLVFIVLPLGGPWLIAQQGSRLLKHPVRVRSVFFNPVLFRATVNGLVISGDDEQPMLGFAKGWVDASVLGLFKKELRFSSIGLEGLQVNLEILPDGRVNLLDLVPPAPPAAPKLTVEPNAAPDQPAAGSKPARTVTVDSFVLRDGAVRVADRTVEPNAQASLSGIELDITGISTKPESQVQAVFRAALGESGAVSLEMSAKPMSQPVQAEAAFLLKNYDLQTLTPYVGKYAGRAVKDGRLDLKLDYVIADNQLRAGHNVLVQHFDFGQHVDSKDALSLPFGLAVALLEDPRGQINISLPVKGDVSDPEFEYFHLVGQVARNFLVKLVTKPLGVLASLSGSEPESEETGYIQFAPGSSEVSEDTRQRVRAVVKGLTERPKLLLEINGSYDPVVDWQAIRSRTYEATYLAMREESRRSDSRLLKYIYEDFFGFGSYGKLQDEIARSSGVVDQAQVDAEARRRLIEEAPADQAALRALAVARARLVHDAMLSEGFDPARLRVGATRQTQSSLGRVPLEFSLTSTGDLPASSSLE